MSDKPFPVLATLGATTDDGRPESDFYETPAIATWKLLEVEKFHRTIWEPACGRGAISKVLKRAGYRVISSDLYDYGFGQVDADFLNAIYPKEPVDIITNPPYGRNLALGFAWRIIEHLQEHGGKGAMLCRLAWLESESRKRMFQTSPLARVWVFSKRLPMMHRPSYGGPQIKAGMMPFAWFVWEADYKDAPLLGWV